MTITKALLVAAAVLFIPSAAGQYVVTAKEDYWACINKNVMESVKEAVRAQDQQAVKGATVLLLALTERGDCFKFSRGDQMAWLDSEILAGYAIVRKPGSLGRYYTFSNLLGSPVQGYVRAPPRKEPPVATARKVVHGRPPARRDDWQCLEPDHENSIVQAKSVGQRMILTRTKDLTVLGLAVQDRAWQNAHEVTTVVLRVDGESYTRQARYGLPEIELDSDLAAALKRGMKVSVSILARNGSARRYNSHLVGFTRAYGCVMDGKTILSQAPKKRAINRIPDDQRLHYARGEVHALKQIVGLCLALLAHSSDELDVEYVAKQVSKMNDFQNPEGLHEYFNKGASDTFSRTAKALEATVKQ